MLSEQAFFEILCDETRRRILGLLRREGELCVCELYYALDLAQPKVSRHLSVMREAEMLSMRREGTWIYYRINSQIPAWCDRILAQLGEVWVSSPTQLQDAARLTGMSNRPTRCCV
ncbi:MAG TPA: metalloregulator ArsR/SmtB family transcription factor [Sulfuriferula sp.]|nr:metalloregulator ArsR/SmtB family transcription factor [Sulfuriferula sp.]